MTYSIVARDPLTGELGVAVQSHYFSVGPIVPWVEAGVGAVATQAMAELSYGPEGLVLMREGKSARQALDTLLALDGDAARRQVGMVDTAGNVAAHTGALCIAYAGHLAGEGVSVQANMMERDTVPAAMLAAYESTTGELSERLLAALFAAENEGGDIRGKQSAAMVIAGGHRQDRPWKDRLLDLRVEDYPEPLPELARLVTLHRAYRVFAEGENAATADDLTTAATKLWEALRLAPGNPEMAFWAAISAASAGQMPFARQLLTQAEAADPRWPELARRLPATDMFELTDDVIDELFGD